MEEQSVDYRLGKHEATLQLILDKVESIEQKMDKVQEEIAEHKGGKRVAGVLGGVIGGVVSAIGTICAIIFGFGGAH